MKTVFEPDDIDIETNPIHKTLYGAETANLLISLLTLPKKEGKTEEEHMDNMKKLVISNVVSVLQQLDDKNLMIVPKEQIPDVFRNA